MKDGTWTVGAKDRRFRMIWSFLSVSARMSYQRPSSCPTRLPPPGFSHCDCIQAGSHTRRARFLSEETVLANDDKRLNNLYLGTSLPFNADECVPTSVFSFSACLPSLLFTKLYVSSGRISRSPILWFLLAKYCPFCRIQLVFTSISQQSWHTKESTYGVDSWSPSVVFVQCTNSSASLL